MGPMRFNRKPADGEMDNLVDSILSSSPTSSGYSGSMDSEVDNILGGSSNEEALGETQGPPSPAGIMHALDTPPPVSKKAAPSKLLSLGKGIAHGISLGGIDEAEGALAPLTGETYEQRRDKFRQSHAEARKNPKTYMLGEGIGGYALSKILPGSPLIKAIGEGAVYGFGSSEGGAGNRLQGAASGAAGGVIGHTAGKAISKVAPRVKDYLSKKLLSRAETKMDAATELATMQAGGKTKGVRDRLMNKQKYPRTANPRSPEFENRAEEIGNELIIDQSVTAPGVAKAIGRKRMMGPLTPAEDIATRAEAAREFLGEKIGQYTKALDSQYENLKRMSENLQGDDLKSFAKHSQSKMALDLYPNPSGIVNRLRKLQTEWSSKSSAHAQWSGKLEPHIKWFEAQAQKYQGKSVPFTKAEEWKRRLYDVIDENRKDPLQMTENKIIQNVARAVKHEIHDSIENISKVTQQKNILEPFIEMKRKYGLMDDIYELSTDWVERRGKGNLKFGLRDMLSAGVGASVGQGGQINKLMWAMAFMGMSKGAKKYGPALGSTLSRHSADRALRTNEIQKYLMNKTQKTAPQIGSALGRTEEAQDHFKKWFGSQQFRESQGGK